MSSSSSFKLLFVGDVVGRSGRDALAAHLPGLIDTHSPELVVVNGENSAHGFGISPSICESFFALGVDVITTGNHVWDQREIVGFIDSEPRLLRPQNYPRGTPGQGALLARGRTGKRILVVNVMLRLFMDQLDDPFGSMESVLARIQRGASADAILVDVHGEATSEMMAMGHFLDGRVTAVLGTHTHVPTADQMLLQGGTAYQSDVGMTGDYRSVIGMKPEPAVHRFVKKMPSERLSPAEGEATLCGALIHVGTGGQAIGIEPIRLGGALSQAVPG